MPTTTTHTYEIRKDGKPCMRWTDPACGYPRETLANMKKHGYRLYIDGKLQR